MTGLFAPARGLGLIMSHRRLGLYAITPFVISFLIFLVLGGWWLVYLWGAMPAIGHRLVEFVAPQASATTATFLFVLALVLFWPAALFLLLYSLFIVNKIVGSPFHALLAEHILIEEGVLEDRPLGVGHRLIAVIQMFLVSLVKSLVFIAIGVILFFVSFIPVLNFLAAFGAFLLVAFDLADYAFEALEMDFSRRVKFFTDNLATFSGIAVAMGLVFFIPGLNFFLFPACVAGASDVVRRIMRSENVHGNGWRW
jgi:uncharacterized protein involved in cysteine biosynthesis